MQTDRSGFEALLLELSASLVGVDGSSLHRDIEHGLERLVRVLDIDAALLTERRDGDAGFETTHSWRRPGIGADAVEIGREDFPWLADRMREGEMVRIRRLDDFPAAAARDRRSFASRGLKSAVVCPVRVGSVIGGAVAFNSVRREGDWSDEVAQRLCVLGQMFASALRREHDEARLQREKEFAGAIIESLPGLFFVLDENGLLIRWNHNREVVTGFSADELRGTHYHDWVLPEYAARADRILEHLVAAGGEASLMHEVPTKDGRRIPHVASGRAARIDGRTYVIGLGVDISALRAAEEQVRRQQAELAHVARVSALGELVAAIAHELNQPLAAIRTNAQAGQRMLAAGSADRAELAEAFGDVADDAVRAGEIIKRLRELLRKGETERAPIQVNDLVRGIEPLARADAHQHGIPLRMELTPGLPSTLGDGIQLQQVLLNLVRNGVDAMGDATDGGHIVVRTGLSGASQIEVSVSDQGPVLDDARFARMFQPFYTTKANGLGIGLSVSRSIVEAHGGLLWATRNADRGLTLHFTLASEPGAR